MSQLKSRPPHCLHPLHHQPQTACLVSHRAAVLLHLHSPLASLARHLPLSPPCLSPKTLFTIVPPAFHDDVFIPLAAASPQQLLVDLIRAADIVQNNAQQHAMKLQFAQGKTEAVVQIRGRGKKKAIAFDNRSRTGR